jgi:hypothetical protein
LADKRDKEDRLAKVKEQQTKHKENA